MCESQNVGGKIYIYKNFVLQKKFCVVICRGVIVIVINVDNIDSSNSQKKYLSERVLRNKMYYEQNKKYVVRAIIIFSKGNSMRINVRDTIYNHYYSNNNYYYIYIYNHSLPSAQ